MLLDKIKLVSRQIERLEDMTDSKQVYLESLVRPIFEAMMNMDEYSHGITKIHIGGNSGDIYVTYVRNRNDLGQIAIPSEFFEADDPVTAAKEWYTKEKERQERKYNTREIARLKSQLVQIKKQLKEIE